MDARVAAAGCAEDSTPFDTGDSLSIRLRGRTALCHVRVEDLLGLPAAIRDRHDYARWLGRFLGFYEPLEAALAAVPPLSGTESSLLASHANRLIDDLGRLGVDHPRLPRVAAARLPSLPTSAHVAGSRYVLMGATLGGRYILRDLAVRLGPALGDATRFFDGAGPLTGCNWIAYRGALDRFGARHPTPHADVVACAIGTFVALHEWFVPFCDGTDRSS